MTTPLMKANTRELHQIAWLSLNPPHAYFPRRSATLESELKTPLRTISFAPNSSALASLLTAFFLLLKISHWIDRSLNRSDYILAQVSKVPLSGVNTGAHFDY